MNIPELSSWTLRISAASLVILAVAAWKGYGVAHAYHTMIMGTVEAVELMARQFALSKIEDEAADLRSEKRDYRIELKMADPAMKEMYATLIEEIDVELDELKAAKHCIVTQPDITLCKELNSD